MQAALDAARLEDAGARNGFTTARALAEPLAARNNPLGLFVLAFLHLQGVGGVSRDLPLARQEYSAALALGFDPAASQLALMLERGLGGPADLPRARQLYAFAAASEVRSAIPNVKRLQLENEVGTTLAQLYSTLSSGAKGPATAPAVTRLKQLIDVPSLYARCAAAELDVFGQRINEDPRTTLDYFRQGAEADVATCDWGLGTLAARGSAGLPRDPVAADVLLRLALRHGPPSSIQHRDLAATEAHMSETDKAKATELLDGVTPGPAVSPQPASNPSPASPASDRLARAYARAAAPNPSRAAPASIKRDLHDSVVFYDTLNTALKAVKIDEAARRHDFATVRALAEPLAAQHNPFALYALAIMHLDGLGGEKRDYAIARREFRASHEGGYDPATLDLARMLERGMGGPADAAAARRLYLLAAASGVAGADANVKRLHIEKDVGLTLAQVYATLKRGDPGQAEDDAAARIKQLIEGPSLYAKCAAADIEVNWDGTLHTEPVTVAYLPEMLQYLKDGVESDVGVCEEALASWVIRSHGDNVAAFVLDRLGYRHLPPYVTKDQDLYAWNAGLPAADRTRVEGYLRGVIPAGGPTKR